MTAERDQGWRVVVDALRASRKYRTLCEQVLQRVSEEALVAERGRARPAIKRAKRQLHQAFGAFLATRPRYERLRADLTGVDEAGLRERFLRILSLHASTQERVPFLTEFYAAIRAAVPEPRSILDLACGLNPLALPWMQLPAGVRYHSVDIDEAQLQFVGACLDALRVDHSEHAWDLVAGAPGIQADVAYLLKTASCLSRQSKDAFSRVVEEVRAPFVVVSYPTASLGGHAKGMTGNYAREFEDLAARRGWDVERIGVVGELLYLVRKGTR
jgi:16S rRNA (guanine(1405)-N(7))-methyltransferase